MPVEGRRNILELELRAVTSSLREVLGSTGPLKEQQGLSIGSYPSHLSDFSFNTITTKGKPRNKMLALSVENFFQFYVFEKLSIWKALPFFLSRDKGVLECRPHFSVCRNS